MVAKESRKIPEIRDIYEKNAHIHTTDRSEETIEYLKHIDKSLYESYNRSIEKNSAEIFNNIKYKDYCV